MKFDTLDKINRSLDASKGVLTLYLIEWNHKTDIISAIEAHDVGWLKQDIKFVSNYTIM